MPVEKPHNTREPATPEQLPAAVAAETPKRQEDPKLVRVSKGLKQKAAAVANAWSGVHDDDLEACGVRDVDVKCKDGASAGAFIAKLLPVAEAIKPNSPLIYPLPDPPDPTNTNEQWVSIWWEYFLPSRLRDCVDDVAGTAADQLALPEATWRLVEAYLAAFDGPVIRANLATAGHADPLQAQACSNSVLSTQKLLMGFLRMVKEGRKASCAADAGAKAGQLADKPVPPQSLFEKRVTTFRVGPA